MTAARMTPALTLALACATGLSVANIYYVQPMLGLLDAIIPLAASLASSAERGRVLGRIMSGLLSGILLARVLSGTAAAHVGWRLTFVGAAALAALMGVMLFFALPHTSPTASTRYHQLMRSLFTIFSEQPTLRHAIAAQGALFAAFSAFWSTLALLFQTPDYHLGSQAAGLFGVLGSSGILAAPLAGRVFALLPDAKSRLNTIYMTGLFLAGAAGSAAGGAAFTRAGWVTVTYFGLACGILSAIIHWSTRRSRSRAAIAAGRH